MHGVLLIDKPKGWTSFDVVNYVRKIAATLEGKAPKNIKVGHTGTLDPSATGLLVLLVGKDYTRQAEFLSKADKTYQVVLKLGAISTTGDEEGERTNISDRIPGIGEVQTALSRFTGEILQTPPAYSAVKVNGQRAYRLARAGLPVALEPRSIKIYNNLLQSYEYPFVRFLTDVSSGTYIRSLAEDVGSELGVGAYVVELRRIRVGDWSVADAVSPSDVALNVHQAATVNP